MRLESRHLYKDYSRIIWRYHEKVNDILTVHNIYERIEKLEQLTKYPTKEEISGKYEAIENKQTESLKCAKRYCSKLRIG